MTLYDDAFSEYITRNGSVLITYNSTNYYPNDFLNPRYMSIFDQAIVQNGAGIRAILLPDQSIVSFTNAQFITLMRLCANAYAKLWDGYNFIVGQIINGTITLQSQISPAWDSYNSTYVPGRTYQPTNESLNNSVTAAVASISSLTTAISSLATVATSGSYTDLSNKPTVPGTQIQSDWNQTSTGSLDYIKNKPVISPGNWTSTGSPVSGTRAIVTVNNVANGFQLSTTKITSARYNITLTTNPTLLSASSASVTAFVAPTNSTNPSDWIKYDQISFGIPAGIALSGVTSVQTLILDNIPIGYFIRLLSATTNSSTAINSFREQY